MMFCEWKSPSSRTDKRHVEEEATPITKIRLPSALYTTEIISETTPLFSLDLHLAVPDFVEFYNAL